VRRGDAEFVAVRDVNRQTVDVEMNVLRPYTASTAAIAERASSTSRPPTSPACRIRDTPASASNRLFRINP